MHEQVCQYTRSLKGNVLGFQERQPTRQSRIPGRALGDVNSGPCTDAVCTALQRSSSWPTAFLCVK